MSDQPVLFRDLSGDEALVMGIIASSTAAAPASIAAIRAEAHWLTERRVKAIVAELRKAGQPIGASRGTPHGYYLIESGSEQEQTVCTYRRQILTMWQTLKKIDSTARLREFAGQLRAELEA